ncbi:MAG TPA: hypothetical protein VF292_15400 [Rhodanobacteraceae bacterium]
MFRRLPSTLTRAARSAVLVIAAAALAGCFGSSTKLQPPTAGIQQLTVQSNGEWATVVRFQNYSYDTGMHVYAIDATLTLNGQAAGLVQFSPGLDIPAMDADIATITFHPDPGGATVLAEAKQNAVQYVLKGTLSVGKGDTGKARSFKLNGRGYISPVPGVSNIWR